MIYKGTRRGSCFYVAIEEPRKSSIILKLIMPFFFKLRCNYTFTNGTKLIYKKKKNKNTAKNVGMPPKTAWLEDK